MANDRSSRDDDAVMGGITLESILAEYKGEAYIDGDRKTPSGILNEKADKIVMEASGRIASQAEMPGDVETVAVAVAADDEAVETDDMDVAFFEQYQYADSDPSPDIAREVSEAIGDRERDRKRRGRAGRRVYDGARDGDDDENDDGEEAFIAEEPQEPDLRVAARRFAVGDDVLLLRWSAVFLMACVMASLTLLFEAGAKLPFGLGGDRLTLTGVLMIMQLIVMIIGLELLIKGVYGIVRRTPGVEILVLLSSVSTLCSGMAVLLRGDTQAGLPYSAVSAFSMAFTLLGEKLYRRSYAETIKAAASVTEPHIGLTEYRGELKRVVLRRAAGTSDGFYNALTSRDVCENAYRYAVPMFVAFSVVLAVANVLVHGQPQYLLHALSAPLAAAAAFSANLAFSAPFSLISKRVRKAGAAMAGWLCALDVTDIDGMCVTDDDIFPEGTLSVSGARIFQGVTPDKAIRYTASLIMTSGSGLARVFGELLRREGMTLVRVDDFECFEGGISALVHGERVMTGSAAYMKLMSVRIPDDINLGNAVFTAVDGKLIVVFSMDYVPVNAVRSAFLEILRCKVRLLFAVQDFNITTKMAEQKFKVPFEDVENLPVRTTYGIARGEGGGRIAAVLTRGGLAPVGALISGAHVLKKTAFFATLISVISAALGVAITALLCWLGAYDAVRAGNLLIFMLSTFVAVLLVCGFAKFKK
ncbi:MAG: hypothetical protein LBJ99_04305 [Oscillospiraceae bacterium]|jgi:hypothetical protein|nr:hypothetical protein [Oscillospiraceae bacterium]